MWLSQSLFFHLSGSRVLQHRGQLPGRCILWISGQSFIQEASGTKAISQQSMNVSQVYEILHQFRISNSATFSEILEILEIIFLIRSELLQILKSDSLSDNSFIVMSLSWRSIEFSKFTFWACFMKSLTKCCKPALLCKLQYIWFWKWCLWLEKRKHVLCLCLEKQSCILCS